MRVIEYIAATDGQPARLTLTGLDADLLAFQNELAAKAEAERKERAAREEELRARRKDRLEVAEHGFKWARENPKAEKYDGYIGVSYRGY